MSAYIVSKAHIDAIVHTARVGVCGREVNPMTAWNFRYWNGERSVGVRGEGSESAVGRMLWIENQRSVSARYPNDRDGEWPGPAGLTLAEIEGYEFQRINPYRRTLTAVQALKAIDGYEYQSCEHEGWHTSEAKMLIDALRKSLIHALPGYDEADWEID